MSTPPLLVSITSRDRGVAIITINNPPVNSLHPDVQAALDTVYRQACDDTSLVAAVITGAGSFFMAGADIAHLQTMQQQSSTNTISSANTETFIQRGDDVFNHLESGRLPTVAAVNGDALGGGCELALACNARVASENAAFGLPELSLGIIPGLGGTQRLPRVIGVEKAVSLTLTGKKLKAKEALAAGLVESVVKTKDLMERSIQLALSLAQGKTKRIRSLYRTDRLKPYEEIKGVIEMARSQAYAKNPHIPQPFAYLDVVDVGLREGGIAGLEAEKKAFARLVTLPVSRSLIHFFFASRATVKIPGLPSKPSGKPIKSVAVIGGGTMGAGICIAFLAKGYRVVLKEINQNALEAGVGRIISQMERVIKSRKMPLAALEVMMRSFSAQIDYSGFDKLDLVIEAALERIDLKQRLFVEFEANTNKTCILSTNTSTIDLDVIAEKLPAAAKSRIIGLHFFSPAHIMPLLEIIRTKETSPDILARCVAAAKAIGKTPVVVGNTVGFGANRGFFPYGQAAGLLVDAGVDPYRIDQALEAFGMPIGVFKMTDLSGIDIAMHVSATIGQAYSDRVYFSTGVKQLFEAKRFGQKAGKGWYDYDGKGKPHPAVKAIEPVVLQARKDAGSMPSLVKVEDETLVEMIIFPVINEMIRIRGEGHVLSDGDVDVLSVMGYGFPAWRGGVLFYGQDGLRDKGGLAYVHQRLSSFHLQFKDNAKAAAFYKPCAELEKRVAETKKAKAKL